MRHLADLRNKANLVYSKDQVAQALDNMAKQITNDLYDKTPIMLCVVNGGIYLMGQLMFRLDFPMEIDYVHASRYGSNLQGSKLNWYSKPKTAIAGRHIAIVDDVLDSGITLKEIENWCFENGALSVYNIVLIDKKPCRADTGIEKADCHGLITEDDYLFGCGLDVKGFYRNIPEIYAVPKGLIPDVDAYLPSGY